jgi:hypothetical protein
VQVLDVLVNKIIKQYIKELKDLWVNKHFNKWQLRKTLVRDQQVLIAKWVGEA